MLRHPTAWWDLAFPGGRALRGEYEQGVEVRVLYFTFVTLGKSETYKETTVLYE